MRHKVIYIQKSDLDKLNKLDDQREIERFTAITDIKFSYKKDSFYSELVYAYIRSSSLLKVNYRSIILPDQEYAFSIFPFSKFWNEEMPRFYSRSVLGINNKILLPESYVDMLKKSLQYNYIHFRPSVDQSAEILNLNKKNILNSNYILKK